MKSILRRHVNIIYDLGDSLSEKVPMQAAATIRRLANELVVRGLASQVAVHLAVGTHASHNELRSIMELLRDAEFELWIDLEDAPKEMATAIQTLPLLESFVWFRGLSPSSFLPERDQQKNVDRKELIECIDHCQKQDLAFAVSLSVALRDIKKLYACVLALGKAGAKAIEIELAHDFRDSTIPYCQRSSAWTEIGRQILMAKRDIHNINVCWKDPLAFVFDVELECSSWGADLRGGWDVIRLSSRGEISFGPIRARGITHFLDAIETSTLVKAKLSGASISVPMAQCCITCGFATTCGIANESESTSPDNLCPRGHCESENSSIRSLLDDTLEKLTIKGARNPLALRSLLDSFLQSEIFSRGKSDFVAQKRFGHNWDLGEGLFLKGEMGWRHRTILERWIQFGAIPQKLSGWKVLDIGPWTGGETFLLAALGAEVDVLEESPTYRDFIRTVASQFNLNIHVIGSTLYELAEQRQDHYDAVYLSGIVSHLSDVTIGLRTAFNQLRDGGVCLIETQTSYTRDGGDQYFGSAKPGWIWFNLNRGTLLEMIRTAGFQEFRVADFGPERRFQVEAKRISWQPLSLRMGLSIPKIP